jgi:hypothetical protein
MAAYLSPVFGAGAQLFNNQGIVLSGGKIYTFQAGTTTPMATWPDSTQAVPNANPIISDGAGRLSNEIWLAAGSMCKFILKDSNDNILGTWDNVAGLNDITTSVTVSDWVATSLTPSYISSTSFSVTGNNTSVFPVNRRVKISVTAGTIYGYVVSSTFSTVTTVVIQPDSTVIDSGISAVYVGLLNSVNVSVPQQYLAANAPVVIASATTTAIGAALSATVTISGVVPITAFDTVVAGIIRFVNWSDATPITYNATNMQLINGASRTNAANDFSVFRSLGSGNWKEEIYQQYTSAVLPSIGCVQGTGALTFSAVQSVIQFRNASLTSGTLSTIIAVPLDLVLPSGATLASITTISARIIVVEMNNAGTAELAIANIIGGTVMNEEGLITTNPIAQVCSFTGAIAVTSGILTLTTPISGTFALGQALSGTNVSSGTYVIALLTGVLGAAGSTYSTNQFTAAASTTITGVAGVGFYSETARTSLPYKIIGAVDVVNTAGVWGNPTAIINAGGNALTAMSSFGYGQTWQTVTRVSGTTYYNTTGKLIILDILVTAGGSAAAPFISVEGINIGKIYLTATTYASVSAVVPPGNSYVPSNGGGTLTSAREFR